MLVSDNKKYPCRFKSVLCSGFKRSILQISEIFFCHSDSKSIWFSFFKSVLLHRVLWYLQQGSWLRFDVLYCSEIWSTFLYCGWWLQFRDGSQYPTSSVFFLCLHFAVSAILYFCVNCFFSQFLVPVSFNFFNSQRTLFLCCSLLPCNTPFISSDQVGVWYSNVQSNFSQKFFGNWAEPKKHFLNL